MNAVSKPEFRRRPSTNGSTASFCTRCLAIVAEGKDIVVLEAAELTHVCDPRTLEYWEKLSKAATFRNTPN